MPSDLQITNIKDQANANSAITIASDGQITVNQNNPTLTLGSNATGGSGLTSHGRIGKICWVTKESISNSLSGAGQVGTMDSDGWALMVNSDSSMYSTSSAGITVALAGTYLVVYGAYIYNQSSTDGYMEVQIARKVSGGSFGNIGRTYQITNNATGGDSNQYYLNMSSAIVSLNANDLIDLYINRSTGTFTCSSSNTNLRLVYLDSNTFTM